MAMGGKTLSGGEPYLAAEIELDENTGVAQKALDEFGGGTGVREQLRIDHSANHQAAFLAGARQRRCDGVGEGLGAPQGGRDVGVERGNHERLGGASLSAESQDAISRLLRNAGRAPMYFWNGFVGSLAR